MGGTCKATANSCAAIGMVLIGGSCQAAAPTPPFNISLIVGSTYTCFATGYTYVWTIESPTTFSVRLDTGYGWMWPGVTYYPISFDSTSYLAFVGGTTFRFYTDRIWNSSWHLGGYRWWNNQQFGCIM